MGLSVNHTLRYENRAGTRLTVDINDAGRLSLLMDGGPVVVMEHEEARLFNQMISHALAQWWDRKVPQPATLRPSVQPIVEGNTDATA